VRVCCCDKRSLFEGDEGKIMGSLNITVFTAKALISAVSAFAAVLGGPLFQGDDDMFLRGPLFQGDDGKQGDDDKTRG
jgi:hypothetical protein